MNSKIIAPLCLTVLGSFTAAQAQDLPLPAPAPARPSAPTKAPPPKSKPVVPTQRQAAPSGPLPGTPEDEGIIIIVPGDEAPQPLPSVQSSVGGVSIWGLSDAAAYDLLKRTLGPQLGVAITLNDGKKSWTVTRAAAGATIPYRELMTAAHNAKRNVPLRFTVDPIVAARTLRSLSAKIEALQSVSTSRTTVNIGASIGRITAALQARPARNNIDLVLTHTAVVAPPPVVVATNGAAPNARFPYLLSEFTTRFDPGIRGRSKNLRMSAANVNNTIVPPGGIFSANKAIGPRTGDGWKEAKMFVNSQVVSGVGAGICQCSSTIYNAALLAGFPIVERHPHTFRVTYVPASRDAAIYWGQKDMKFRNNSSGPLLVRTRVTGNRFHAQLWGAVPSDVRAEVTSRIISRANGTRSESYRTITDSSGTRSQRLSRDYYKPHP